MLFPFPSFQIVGPLNDCHFLFMFRPSSQQSMKAYEAESQGTETGNVVDTTPKF